MRGGARPCGGRWRGRAALSPQPAPLIPRALVLPRALARRPRTRGGRGRGAGTAVRAAPAGLPGGGGGLLDFRPRLGAGECSRVAAAAVAAAGAAAAVAASPGPPLMAALAAGGLARELFMERLHAERYITPAELALPGSGFGAFGGLQRLHYRVQRAGRVRPGEAAWACHFFHGFGAR